MSVIYINSYQFAGVSYDPDAANYIAAVETADGQSLEAAVKDAINAFVIGCKSDGIWSAIKASCILAGARTLNGALQPLAGTAPTNYNFVTGDYNRETGLVGDGSTKYLNTNYISTSLSSIHMGIGISAGTGLGGYMGTVLTANNSGEALVRHPQRTERASLLRSINQSALVVGGASTSTTGFVGGSKTNLGVHTHRSGGNNIVVTQTVVSSSEQKSNYVFCRNNDVNNNPGYFAPSGHRFYFYSIGESLDLAKLDARVTTLINAFSAAIP